MKFRMLAAIFLFCNHTAIADERKQLVTDVPLDKVEAGRNSAGDMAMLKHYEGLKHFARGRMLELSDRIPDALQAYQLANQFDGQATDLIRHMLPLCFKLEQTASALKLMRRSLGIDPKQPDLWMRYAQELHDLQRHAEALEAVETAFKTIDYSSYPAFAADLYVVRASCLDSRQRPAEAVAAYNQALKIIQDRNRYLDDPFSPTLEDLPVEEAKLLERLARANMKAKQWDASMQCFKQAYTVLPREDGRLELNLAEVYLAAQKPEAALPHLRKAVSQHPPSDESYRLLIAALKQTAQTGEIITTLKQLHQEAPQHTAINLVLAEQYTEAKQFNEAEILYREIFTVEQAPFKEAVLGYYRLLLAQDKPLEVLAEFDQILQQPARAKWARAAVVALLADVDLLKKLMNMPTLSEVQPATRIMLIKLAIQVELWSDAEKLARVQLVSDVKPQEVYLLLARTLLEQNRFAELAALCQTAIDHPTVSQPLIFHMEMIKAQARQRNTSAVAAALLAAHELCAPGTMDEHKLLCTELYCKHLLKQYDACITQANAVLQTSVARGPWARQVRYILAHANEAVAHFDQALEQYDAILKNDPNDSEAMAAQARCLLFQNVDLKRAETIIRAAIELDLIEQNKKQRYSAVPVKLQAKPDYQATLGTILLRNGKASEGTTVLTDLVTQKQKPDPWVMLAIGDAYLMQHKNDEARQAWQRAVELMGVSGMMGTDLTGSLQARLKAVQPAIVPASATTSSSPRQP